MDKSALRRCLVCRNLFPSSSPAERICRKCKKRNKGKKRVAADMECIPLTVDMERFISRKEQGWAKPARNRDEDSYEDTLIRAIEGLPAKVALDNDCDDDLAEELMDIGVSVVDSPGDEVEDEVAQEVEEKISDPTYSPRSFKTRKSKDDLFVF